ncbi:MAG: prepilin-type N-terminal cleavage/methylation domain-containing protein [Methylophaga sp.]|nr:prepilin-type N-terminal cleavage/methylation domain-containing protein [Methylophaga sp.]
MTVRHNIFPFLKTTRGATLIELIITIVIISVSLSGILTVVNLTTSHSADPMVQQQAIAIAESYLEEITLLPITATPDTSVAGDRSTFDNITDYNGLNDTNATDRNGNIIVGLENYSVAVAIADETVSGIAMKSITVTVTRSSTQDIVLTGYRADY